MQEQLADPTPLPTARFATLVWIADAAAHEKNRGPRQAQGYLSAEAQEAWA